MTSKMPGTNDGTWLALGATGLLAVAGVARANAGSRALDLDALLAEVQAKQAARRDRQRIVDALAGPQTKTKRKPAKKRKRQKRGPPAIEEVFGLDVLRAAVQRQAREEAWRALTAAQARVASQRLESFPWDDTARLTARIRPDLLTATYGYPLSGREFADGSKTRSIWILEHPTHGGAEIYDRKNYETQTRLMSRKKLVKSTRPTDFHVMATSREAALALLGSLGLTPWTRDAYGNSLVHWEQ